MVNSTIEAGDKNKGVQEPNHYQGHLDNKAWKRKILQKLVGRFWTDPFVMLVEN